MIIMFLTQSHRQNGQIGLFFERRRLINMNNTYAYSGFDILRRCIMASLISDVTTKFSERYCCNIVSGKRYIWKI